MGFKSLLGGRLDYLMYNAYYYWESNTASNTSFNTTVDSGDWSHIIAVMHGDTGLVQVYVNKTLVGSLNTLPQTRKKIGWFFIKNKPICCLLATSTLV